MGKVEDLRAIKDARFAAAQKTVPEKAVSGQAVTERAVTDKAQRVRPVTLKPAAAGRPPVESAAPAPAANNESLCGHRAIGGKTCIRAKGHDEASHKYAKS